MTRFYGLIFVIVCFFRMCVTVFKNKKGSDLVLEVNEDDYDKCNIEHPIKKMEDENSVFEFDRSGSFYFVSGNKDKCKEGQKFVIVVAGMVLPPSTPVPSLAPVGSHLSPKADAPGKVPIGVSSPVPITVHVARGTS